MKWLRLSKGNSPLTSSHHSWRSVKFWSDSYYEKVLSVTTVTGGFIDCNEFFPNYWIKCQALNSYLYSNCCWWPLLWTKLCIYKKKKIKVQLELSKHFSEQGPVKIDRFIDIYFCPFVIFSSSPSHLSAIRQHTAHNRLFNYRYLINYYTYLLASIE